MIKINSLISIIIPCFNQGIFLPEAVNSILNQSYQNWECIIVNDGSTDNTQEIAQFFCQQDNRFFYIEQKNQGLSAARNAGIEKSTGKYIQFLDSDDIILPKKLEIQLKQLINSDTPSLSICNYYYCDKDNTQSRVLGDLNLSPHLDLKSPLKDLIIRWEEDLSIPVHCFLFDAVFFKKNNIRFNTELPNHEDWDCWLSIFLLFPKVFFINEKLVAYRIHDTSMTINEKKMYQGFIKAIKLQKKKIKPYPNLLIYFLEKEKKIINKHLLRKKIFHIKKNKNNKAIKLYKKYIPWPIQKFILKYL